MDHKVQQMRPEAARDAWLATHGGMSLELCAVICHISPMAIEWDVGGCAPGGRRYHALRMSLIYPG